AAALAGSAGFRHVVRGDGLDERLLLEECTRIIRERDPDVIEGHNIFRFDLEYLEARARRHDVVLRWGRDGSALRRRVARLQIAERTIDYRRWDAAGRHVVDTWMLAQLHDAGARDLPSFGLKELARHFGVAAPDRTYIDASQVARTLREDPERLRDYATTDALGVVPALLQHLRDFRIRAKRLARETAEPAERAHLGALQQSFKILINAFYGYLAFSGGHWNDYNAANRVTAEGRAVVASLLERLTGLGATPVEADTDGVYFVPPPGHRPDDDDALLERIAVGLPAGLQLELDGRYAAMFSYKMKTYALLDARDRLQLK